MKGNIHIERVANDLNCLLYNHDVVTTLYDFYGFKHKNGRNAVQMQEALRAAIKPQHQHKFLPYLQMHEFEALLYSNPDILCKELGDSSKAADFQRMVDQAGGAEAVNDSPETAPSKRIEAVFSHYNKVYHGEIVAQHIGLERIRAACPRFNQWLAHTQDLCRVAAV